MIVKEKTRTFRVTKNYAEDGRQAEIKYYTEKGLLNEPIHPFIKECVKHADFHNFQIGYFTHTTDIVVV